MALILEVFIVENRGVLSLKGIAGRDDLIG
jgi:hypothetical protein